MFKNSQPETDAGFKYINRRYAAALLLTASLLLVSQVIIQLAIMGMKSDARVVNLSGRQRMLSQKITKSAFGTVTAGNGAERLLYAAELDNARDIMEKTHKALRYGSRELKLPGDNSRAINALYEEMEPYYEDMMRSAEALAALCREEAGTAALLPHVNRIHASEIRFLDYMNRIVLQYEEESSARQRMLQTLEFSILVIALAVLAFEWRIVFKPGQKKILEGFENVRRNEAYLNHLFETSPSITIIFDGETLKAVKYNMMAVRLIREWLGIDLDETTSFADITPGADDPGLTARLLERIRQEKEFSNLEVTLCPEREVMLSVKTVESGDKEVFLIGLSDITTVKQMATFDGMTNMLNRRAGMELLSYLFEQDASRQVNVGICFVDIDNLKPVNDEYGHQEGDFYIQAVAQAIHDVMGRHYKTIRYGGDEMLVLAEGDDIAGFEERVAAVTVRLDAIRRDSAKHYRMSISYGFAYYPNGNSTTFAELIEEADFNMYEQKKRKRAGRRKMAAVA